MSSSSWREFKLCSNRFARFVCITWLHITNQLTFCCVNQLKWVFRKKWEFEKGYELPPQITQLHFANICVECLTLRDAESLGQILFNK